MPKNHRCRHPFRYCSKLPGGRARTVPHPSARCPHGQPVRQPHTKAPEPALNKDRVKRLPLARSRARPIGAEPRGRASAAGLRPETTGFRSNRTKRPAIKEPPISRVREMGGGSHSRSGRFPCSEDCDRLPSCAHLGTVHYGILCRKRVNPTCRACCPSSPRGQPGRRRGARAERGTASSSRR